MASSVIAAGTAFPHRGAWSGAAKRFGGGVVLALLVAYAGTLLLRALAWLAGSSATMDWGMGCILPDLPPLLLLPATAMTLELLVVGWQRCSWRRVIVGGSDSARSDLAYVALGATGAADVLVRLLALDAVTWVEKAAGGAVGLLPLAELSWWIQLPLLYVGGSFAAYWEHRLLHTRFFWALHRSHHSPSEFTIISGFRGHPLEVALSIVCNIAWPTLMGFSAEAITAFYSIVPLVAFYLHSNLTALAPLERLGFCTPAGHRIHHGLDESHHDRNFGELVNWWDRLFGTYAAPDQDMDTIAIGVDDPHGLHNNDNAVLEIVRQTIAWLRGLAPSFSRA